jgi:prevent-host-death family protein
MTIKKGKEYKRNIPQTVSIAEGKKGFSGLVADAVEGNREFIITKRGQPVAVIIPYDEYKNSKRLEGYKKILDARDEFLKSDISADEIFKESRKQLEDKT